MLYALPASPRHNWARFLRLPRQRLALGNETVAQTTPVAIVHASRLIRDGTKDLLAHQPGIHLVGSFGSAREVLQQPSGGEHVLLYDLPTARQDGPAVMMELHQRLPQAKILMFNVVDDDQAIIECVRVGASECVLQDASLKDLLTAIQSVALGAPHSSPRVITSLFAYVASLQAGEERLRPFPLTKREEQIPRIDGRGTQQQGDRLAAVPAAPDRQELCTPHPSETRPSQPARCDQAPAFWKAPVG